MKRVCAVAAAAILAACSRDPQAAGPAARPQAPEPLKATVWTADGELYLEYPPLARNQKERLAIHLTRLTDFRAVKDAACEVRLDWIRILTCSHAIRPRIRVSSERMWNLSPRVTCVSAFLYMVGT